MYIFVLFYAAWECSPLLANALRCSGIARWQNYRRIDMTFPFGHTNLAGWPIVPT
jgi:hypothetical protein